MAAMITASQRAASVSVARAASKEYFDDSRRVVGALSFLGGPLHKGKTLKVPSIGPCKKRIAVKAVQREDPSTEEASEKLQVFFDNVQTRWEKVEDKPTFLAYSAGTVAFLWFSSALVSAFNSVPVLPKVLEFIGIVYTGWFVYRYLLFTPNRQELIAKIDELSSKITGEVKDTVSDIQSAGSQKSKDP